MAEGNQIMIPALGLEFDVKNLDEVINKMERIEKLSSKIMNIEPIDDYLLKLSDVAKVLGVNINTVGKLVNSGKLKSLNIGCRKVRKKELDRFMQEAESSGLTLEEL